MSRHSRAIIAASVVTSTTTLLTTLPSVLVTAVWAPIDVVVEARDQGPGRRAREEGDRHPLDLGEQGAAQVVDQALADAGARPALDDLQQRVADGGGDGGGRQPRDHRPVGLRDRRVEDRPHDERRHEAEQGGEHDGHEEHGDRAAVGPGERPRPPQRPARHGRPGELAGGRVGAASSGSAAWFEATKPPRRKPPVPLRHMPSRPATLPPRGSSSACSLLVADRGLLAGRRRAHRGGDPDRPAADRRRRRRPPDPAATTPPTPTHATPSTDRRHDRPRTRPSRPTDPPEPTGAIDWQQFDDQLDTGAARGADRLRRPRRAARSSCSSCATARPTRTTGSASLLVNPGGPGFGGTSLAAGAEFRLRRGAARALRHRRLGPAGHRLHDAGDRLHRRLRRVLRRHRHHARRRRRAPADRRPGRGASRTSA